MTPEQQLIEGVLRCAVGHYNLVDLHALCKQAEEALAAYRATLASDVQPKGVDLKAQALALCHALEEQPGSQYQTAAVLAAFKVYRAFESIEKHGEIRQWVFDVAAPCAAVAHAPLPLGWGFNHAQQAKGDEGNPIEGVWEVGWMNEDGVFSELLTIDADNYFQPEAAEPLARAILARLADSDVPVQGSQS